MHCTAPTKPAPDTAPPLSPHTRYARCHPPRHYPTQTIPRTPPQNLGGWAVAALCRSMSLDNLLTFLTAALLERQVGRIAPPGRRAVCECVCRQGGMQAGRALTVRAGARSVAGS